MLSLLTILSTSFVLFLSVFATFTQGFSHPSTLVERSSKFGLSTSSQSENIVLYARNGEEEMETKKKGLFGGFFSTLDDVAEDFFYKRMGKGEIFYGKRKFKPSGDVDGDYNGFGLSDKLKIDMTREYKDAWLEEKQMRDELKLIKAEKEERDASR